MSAVTIIASILIILVAIIVIASVLMQEGSKQGLGAIGGGAETFFGKSKAKSYEGKLAMITKISVVVFIALALIMTVTVSKINNDAAEQAAQTSVEDMELDTESIETPADGETEETADDAAVEAEPADDAVTETETADEAAAETETAEESEETNP